MSPKAVAYILTGWDLDSWTGAMRKLDPARDIRFYPDHMGRREDIAFPTMAPADIIGFK